MNNIVIVSLLMGALGLISGALINKNIDQFTKKKLELNRCPHCMHYYTEESDIALINCIKLRFKCNNCNKLIKPAYVFIEVISMTMYILITLRYGLSFIAIKQFIALLPVLGISVVGFNNTVKYSKYAKLATVITILSATIYSYSSSSWTELIKLISPVIASLTAAILLYLNKKMNNKKGHEYIDEKMRDDSDVLLFTVIMFSIGVAKMLITLLSAIWLLVILLAVIKNNKILNKLNIAHTFLLSYLLISLI
ncbi:prepilin peptidase [Clostridium tertium]|uniref:prepilin peptidase n=1 Tax=Clostridium tertium TaxID=1559 RepID=UPI0023B2A2A6|nr:prepilin peptidase [Clostridium tertium]